MAAGSWQSVGIAASVYEFLMNYFARVVANIGIPYVIKVKIPAGTSLSEDIDISGFRNIAIEMPDQGWDSSFTSLSFQCSANGAVYRDVFDSAGNELTVTCAEDRVIVDIPELAPLRFIRIRVGTSTTQPSQNVAADTYLSLIVKG